MMVWPECTPAGLDFEPPKVALGEGFRVYPTKTGSFNIKYKLAGEDVEAWVMPDIEAISYGRKVGYEVREADDIPAEIFAVSATGVRGGNKANVSERVMEFMIEEGIWDGE